MGNRGKMVTDEVAGSTGTDNLLLAIPCLYDDHGMLIQMLTYLAPNQEDMASAFNVLRASAPQFGIGNAEKHIIETIKKNWKMNEKDIVASFIRKVCEETKAHTLVKIDEAYSAMSPVKPGASAKDARDGLPPDLKDAPNRLECIQVVTETKTFRRLSAQTFSRKSEDKDAPAFKEIVWGQVLANEDTVDKQMFSGRFVNLLMPKPPEDLYLKKSGPSP